MNPAPRLAFYAPLKPPSHGNPSGDRLIAQRLMHTLGLAGFEVTLASHFRSYDRAGDAQRQARIRHTGERLAERLIRRYLKLPASQRPQIWFTYHLYHKAPDWIGPRVAKALAIPYVIAEASYAGKQAGGRWDLGFNASREAIQQADLILSLNPCDEGGVLDARADAPLAYLAPYLPPGLENASYTLAEHSRLPLAQRFNLDPDLPWLIAVGMMRPGDKETSYKLLAESLKLCTQQNRQVILVGDGRAEAAIKQAFAEVPAVCMTGRLTSDTLIPLLQASDLMVWPAVNEAFGMALLEAQAAGTWVIAGNEGGVSSIVSEGDSGNLVTPRDPAALASAVDRLLQQPEQLACLGEKAKSWCLAHHSESQAEARLRELLIPLIQ
ncbi:glycosyltransferase family 4 protein [Marinobacterium lutimaris]|uniref:Glycosyltransferase involved in cell wall bisynthesis n=1 Tax=Marinobacterium lutimaris TaxID=568106 RepID=A0A1H6D8V1_9GAMM|nr:glycosyltransferase family 4 protein [Marinobacterium lutimaris]SEG81145.1 Glycosyltransferase involved in cell wall bisynthesis [Marinobacterium lutimaris]